MSLQRARDLVADWERRRLTFFDGAVTQVQAAALRGGFGVLHVVEGVAANVALSRHELLASVLSPAAGKVDLLTVLVHELGHVLGFEHSDEDDAMASTLAPGVRRMPHMTDLDSAIMSAALTAGSSALLAVAPQSTLTSDQLLWNSTMPGTLPFLMDRALLLADFRKSPSFPDLGFITAGSEEDELSWLAPFWPGEPLDLSPKVLL